MSGLQGRDLLSIADLSSDELAELLALAKDLKTSDRTLNFERNFERKTLGLLFRKASTRTRVSFSVAMHQLGGHVIDLDPNVTQVSRGEPIEDTARVLNRYVDALAIRTFDQSELETFAENCQIPIINALTDLEHPCQALADLLTAQENFGTLAGLTLTYIGDGNNVAHSLMFACALAGMNIRIATPSGFEPNQAIAKQAKSIAQKNNTEVLITNDPEVATRNTHILYTDVWASMGQESEASDRLPIFQPYQINQQMVSQADPEVIVLHCLPAHRGEEITAEVLEGNRSRVWDQAENRLHAQKALLASVL
jgi:ornithine carbamoyltransferase